MLQGSLIISCNLRSPKGLQMDGTVSYHSDTGSQKDVWSRLATTDQVEADASWPREGRAWEELPKRQSGPAKQYWEF